MKEKLKTTSFWLGVGSSVIIILSCVADLFGFAICAEQIEKVVVSICSVLVMLGIVTKKNTIDSGSMQKDELIAEIENFKTDNKD
jgi:uncharacterized membrane protein